MEALFIRDDTFKPARSGGRIYLLSPHMLGIDYQTELVTVEDPKWYKRVHATNTITEISEDMAIANKPEESCIVLSIRDYDVDLERVQTMSTLAILGCPSIKTE